VTADRSASPTQVEARLECTRCGARIELCAFCERADCPSPICYRCLRQVLRQSLAQPHAHGG
jgi:hypothetical protein